MPKKDEEFTTIPGYEDTGPRKNSGPRDVNGVAGKRLLSFIERVERLEEDKKGISGDIKDVYAEAKGTGFDVKIIKAIIKRRKMEADDRREMDELLELYQIALGMMDAEGL